jgi:hypothetical protein
MTCKSKQVIEKLLLEVEIFLANTVTEYLEHRKPHGSLRLVDLVTCIFQKYT